jgi:ligand-binding sensor domain-containing protein
VPSVSESSGLRGLTSLRQLRIRALVVAALLAPWRPAAAVLAEPPAGYVHRAWTARDGLPVDGLTDLLQTRDGYLWIATWDGLVRFDGVRFVRFHMGNTDALPSNRVTRLVELPDGRLLVRTAVPTAVVEHRAGRFARLEGALASVSGPRDTSRRGAEGWSVAGTSVRRDGREVLRTTSRILRHLVDREGNLWLATLSSGLHRLRRAQVGMVELPGDAQQRRAQSVWEDRAGGVSIATTAGGVYRLADGRLTRVADTHSLAWLGGDAMGRVWIAADVIAGVGAPLDAATRAALAAERRRDFHGMFEDRRGARWLPAVSGGISRLADGRWAHFGEAEGIPRRVIRALHETRDGALWLLTYGNGLVRVHDGRFERLGAADGLASDFPRGFHEDADGIVWIGSFGNGLTRLDRAGGRSLAAARLRVIRTRDGLPDDVVHQILEDDAGRLWIGSNRGIFTVRRADLNALAAGRLGRVHAVRYDEEQGMRSREVNGGGFPAGARTRDGRLW